MFIVPKTTITVDAVKAESLQKIASNCTVEELNHLTWAVTNPVIKQIALAKLKEFKQ